MSRVFIGVIAALAVALAVQTWRLGRAEARSDRLTTCQTVDRIEQEVRDESDEALAASISDP